jgi:hypothetical protein
MKTNVLRLNLISPSFAALLALLFFVGSSAHAGVVLSTSKTSIGINNEAT